MAFLPLPATVKEFRLADTHLQTKDNSSISLVCTIVLLLHHSGHFITINYGKFYENIESNITSNTSNDGEETLIEIVQTMFISCCINCRPLYL